MRQLKRLFNIFIALAILFYPSKVFAQNLGIPSIPNPTIFEDLEQIINFAAQLIRPAFILTFIGVILYAAAVWLTSQGDDKKIEKSRKIIVAAIIGLAIAVFAPTITGVVASLLGVDTINIFGN